MQQPRATKQKLEGQNSTVALTSVNFCRISYNWIFIGAELTDFTGFVTYKRKKGACGAKKSCDDLSDCSVS